MISNFQSCRSVRWGAGLLSLVTVFLLFSCKNQGGESGLATFGQEESDRYALLLADLEREPRCFSEGRNPLEFFSPEEIASDKVNYDAFEFLMLNAPHISCSSAKGAEIQPDEWPVPAKTLLAEGGPPDGLHLSGGQFKAALKILHIGAQKGKLIIHGVNGRQSFTSIVRVSSSRTKEEIRLPLTFKQLFTAPISINSRFIGENKPGNALGWQVKYLSPSEQEG